MADSNVRKLAAQLLASKMKLQAQGGPAPQSGTHPSVLNRIFDVVSRPNYTVANAYKAVVDKINENKAAGRGGNVSQLPGLLGGGAWRGLSGKNKTHFADVIAAGSPHGNRVVRGVAGLGADIALDPLTYFGPGIEKAIAPIEATAEAGKAVRAAQLVSGKASDVGSLSTAGRVAENAAKAAKPGRVTLDFMGKPVVGSERAYEALAKIGRPIAATPPVDTANKLFRTAATYPGRLKNMMQVPKAIGIAGHAEFDKDIISKFGKLTREEGAQVSHALEAGTDLTGTKSKAGIDLGELQKYWREHKRSMDEIEQANGIFKPGQLDPNYVPKHVPKGEHQSDEFKALKDTEHKIRVSIKKGKEYGTNPWPTLSEFKDAGLHPHENIIDVARLRNAEFHRNMALDQFRKAAVGEYAVPIKGAGKQAVEKTLQGQKYVELPSELAPHIGDKAYMVPEQVRNALRDVHALYQSDEATSKFFHTFDSMQRVWKTGVTTINPAHHARNMIGDMFLNWEAGVQSPADYSRAMRVMRGTGKVKIGNMNVDAHEIWDLYRDVGARSGFMNIDLVGSSTPGAVTEAITRPVNKVQEGLRNIVSKREDFTRVANFTHAMKKYAEEHGVSSWADMKKAAEFGAERVKKFNFDYSDLTHFESHVRRAIPFYTFMRKNIPLQLEMLALHPGKISQVPKGFNALQQLLGTDPQHLPMTEVLPAYLKDLATVRLRGEGQGHNAMYADFPIPLEDLSRMFSGSTSDVVRKQLGQTSPFARVPMEVGFKQSTLTGQPIGSLPRYAANQFTVARNIVNTVAPKQPNRVVRPGEKTHENPLFNWADWLTGINTKEITPQAQRSELQRQKDIVQGKLRTARTKRINQALRSHR